MVVCSLCKRDGHLKVDCPEDFKKVQLEPLPALTPEFLCVLNDVCVKCYSEYEAIPSVVQSRLCLQAKTARQKSATLITIIIIT